MSNQAWRYNIAAGRWAGFGPYYAMFPVDFAKQVVETAPEGGSVLDPFCGRGTVPFVAQATGRSSLGIDINPMAWVFAKVKTSPEPSAEKLVNRLDDLQRAVRPTDKKAENEFQEWAWSEEVLGFLNVARRLLDWRQDKTDRTLMGFILVHAHAKLGEGISNQMQKARAMGPKYAVRWWKERKMYPPAINPCQHFRRKITWRYAHGVIGQEQKTEIICDDSARVLSNRQKEQFDLLFTSPPYFGVTDYRQDSWIRLWLLGEGPSLPDWKKDNRTTRQELYRQMTFDVLCSAKPLLKPYGVVWVRTDAREFTRDTTLDALRAHWPKRKLFMRYNHSAKPTQTAHFGNRFTQSREIDFVIPGGNRPPILPSAWEQL